MLVWCSALATRTKATAGASWTATDTATRWRYIRHNKTITQAHPKQGQELTYLSKGINVISCTFPMTSQPSSLLIPVESTTATATTLPMRPELSLPPTWLGEHIFYNHSDLWMQLLLLHLPLRFITWSSGIPFKIYGTFCKKSKHMTRIRFQLNPPKFLLLSPQELPSLLRPVLQPPLHAGCNIYIVEAYTRI